MPDWEVFSDQSRNLQELKRKMQRLDWTKRGFDPNIALPKYIEDYILDMEEEIANLHGRISQIRIEGQINDTRAHDWHRDLRERAMKKELKQTYIRACLIETNNQKMYNCTVGDPTPLIYRENTDLADALGLSPRRFGLCMNPEYGCEFCIRVELKKTLSVPDEYSTQYGRRGVNHQRVLPRWLEEYGG